MDAPALRRVFGDLVIFAPAVRQAAAIGDHASQRRDLALQPLPCVAGQKAGLVLERGEETMAALGEQRDGIGAEQLIVTDRGRDCVRAWPRRLEAGLRVVETLAAGLEGVDADDLLARQPGGARGRRIGAFEFGSLACSGTKPQCSLRGLQEVGGNWNFGPRRDRRPRRRRQRTERPRRSRIDWRLGEYVVGKRDGFMVAALGIAQFAFLAD